MAHDRHIVREATLEDEGSVVALWRRCDLIVAYNDPVCDFRFALTARDAAMLVVERENHAIIGTVMVGHDGHRGWMYYVATAPERRGAGIGRTLVGAGENWLRARGVAKAQLMVRETNPAAQSFYDRLGYEVMPRVLMSKWLDPAPATAHGVTVAATNARTSGSGESIAKQRLSSQSIPTIAGSSLPDV